MSIVADPLALYGRLIDKGVDKALACALSDALHETPSGLATDASVAELREEMRQEFASVRADSVKTNARIDVLSARIDALPNAILIRLGSLMVVLAGAIVTSLRLWPVH